MRTPLDLPKKTLQNKYVVISHQNSTYVPSVWFIPCVQNIHGINNRLPKINISTAWVWKTRNHNLQVCPNHFYHRSAHTRVKLLSIQTIHISIDLSKIFRPRNKALKIKLGIGYVWKLEVITFKLVSAIFTTERSSTDLARSTF